MELNWRRTRLALTKLIFYWDGGTRGHPNMRDDNISSGFSTFLLYAGMSAITTQSSLISVHSSLSSGYLNGVWKTIVWGFFPPISHLSY